MKKNNITPINKIKKRDGRIVYFDSSRIELAVTKAFMAAGQAADGFPHKIAKHVLVDLIRLKKLSQDENFLPTVELIQDIIEEALMAQGFHHVAKAYILYRQERTKSRRQKGIIPEHVKKLVQESKQYFKNSLGEFVYYRTYARWIDTERRRETWIETVDRYISFMQENLGEKLKQVEYDELRQAILKQEVMPSMRLFQFAGGAVRSTNVCAYNCSYIAPQNFQDVAEIMYISMCGTGIGWSVESQNVQRFPQIEIQTGKKLPRHTIADSKEGWADALALGMRTWAEGNDIDFDFSFLRPAGARLKTMGGKSSGPEPLQRLLEFTRRKILSRQGKRLRNIDLHDIICMIGDCVVAGGVRRSAMISLSDLDDQDIRDAKKGQFYITEPQRSLANNSAVYTHKSSSEEFLEEWMSLVKSGSGERGIFNRGSLAQTLPSRRIKLLKKHGGYFDAYEKNIIGLIGTNPCGEIILQSKQFCNLSEVVVRADDTRATLIKKVRLAALIGTYQSTLTNFPYLSKEWKINCEAERLLGVSITGQWDSSTIRHEAILKTLKQEAILANRMYAKRFAIKASSCITCVKPSGTVSQLVDCASGMHPRHAPFYIRRIRISATDALFKMLRDQGVPYQPEVGQSEDTATTYVFSFPIKSPAGSIYKNNLSALDLLEYWKIVKLHYTEHNPSVTISVGEEEWISVANWVYENWEIVGGLSFLPRSNHVYQLAPYEEIDEERYEEMKKKFIGVDFAKIVTYEAEDETEMKRELACSGGTCEL